MISDDDEAARSSGWDSSTGPRPDPNPNCAVGFLRRKVKALDDESVLAGSRVEHEVADAKPRSVTDAVVNIRAVSGSAKRPPAKRPRNKQTPIQNSAEFWSDHDTQQQLLQQQQQQQQREEQTTQHALLLSEIPVTAGPVAGRLSVSTTGLESNASGVKSTLVRTREPGRN